MQEPTNTDIMNELAKINARLDKGDARFGEIGADLKKIGGVMDAATTLEAVAQTWQLASLGGRIVKWVASVAAAIGALFVLYETGPK